MPSVYGNSSAREQLASAVRSERPHHAYLLAGPAGIGKATLARAFAQALLCEVRAPGQAEACDHCPACRRVAHGNHPDLLVVEPAANRRSVDVERVRETIYVANLAPTLGAWRILLLPEVERLTLGAMNALLKTLEEPPEQVVLLLTTAVAENVLPTVLSRCQVVPMGPLAVGEIERALSEHWHAAPEDARSLAGLAGGRLGWAVRALEHPEQRSARAEQVEQLAGLSALPVDERMRVLGALAKDVATAQEVLDVWILWWRDVVLAAAGTPTSGAPPELHPAARRVGGAIGLERAEAFLRALVRTAAALDQNVNPRLAFEVLALDLPRA